MQQTPSQSDNAATIAHHYAAILRRRSQYASKNGRNSEKTYTFAVKSGVHKNQAFAGSMYNIYKKNSGFKHTLGWVTSTTYPLH